MRYSGIGGQAVMEGIMMRNQERYAVAVRKPNGEIEIKVSDYKGSVKNKIIKELPIIRGVVSFIDSLYLGMSTLMYSASFFEEEEEKEMTKKQENLLLGGTMVFSLVIALGLFFALPYFLSGLFEKMTDSTFLIAFLEGVIRLAIFILYIALVSLTKDIKRTFMYHGAEHKCINCIEHGLELTVENVRKSSKEHKRCGTSFLLIVMLLSILFFMFIQVDSKVYRLLLRFLLIPVIAGVSYELIRMAGRFDNWFVNLLSKPGLWMQALTTREPEDDMIEVGIAVVEAVFDWRTWQKEQDMGEA